MRALRSRWTAHVDRQHRCPSGPVGRLVGQRMLRQHAPETAWTVGLLQLRPADRVLEIGFGAGRGLELAAAQAPGGHITGVDLSDVMVRAAARRNRAAVERGSMSLVRGDIGSLPLAARRFDRLFSIHTFYFWPDQHAVALRLAELLAPGGRLVSTFATARQLPSGAWEYWELHGRAEALAELLGRHPGLTATLRRGPNSRRYNNVALVVDVR